MNEAAVVANSTDIASIISALDSSTGGSGVLLLLAVGFFGTLIWLIMKFVKDVTAEHRQSTKELADNFAKTVDKGHIIIQDNTRALADLRVAVATRSNVPTGE